MDNTPEWTEWVRVDTVVECHPILVETEKELLAVAAAMMPGGAYGGEAPGEDDWPEPDSPREKPWKLARVWEFLSVEAREDIRFVVERGRR